MGKIMKLNIKQRLRDYELHFLGKDALRGASCCACDLNAPCLYYQQNHWSDECCTPENKINNAYWKKKSTKPQ